MTEEDAVQSYSAEIAKTSKSTRQRIIEKFATAALGSVPWVGGFLSAAASLKTEDADRAQNELLIRWMQEHQIKMNRLGETINTFADRVEGLGEKVDARIQSEEYLDLVRKSFRSWDHADTDEKRSYIANLITHAAGTRLCSDDVIRLFIDWLNQYHEAHLNVIAHIYNNPGCTRLDIWNEISGDSVREDSAEADLFKMLINDLSIGLVIRQARATDGLGRFLKKRPAKRRGDSSRTMKSAFDNTDQYVLTELGKQFVHYSMTEFVKRIESDGID